MTDFVKSTLDHAQSADLDRCIVIGRRKNGEPFVSGSTGNEHLVDIEWFLNNRVPPVTLSISKITLK
jgi:hypothetical protein